MNEDGHGEAEGDDGREGVRNQDFASRAVHVIHPRAEGDGDDDGCNRPGVVDTDLCTEEGEEF